MTADAASRRRRARARRRLWSYATSAGRVVLGLLAVLLLAMAVVALPYAIKAAWGEGAQGTFTAERQTCSTRGCAHYGTWRANPPSTQVVDDAQMDEWPDDLPLGSSVPALYLGETDPLVVYAEGSRIWLWVLVVIGGAGFLVWQSVPEIIGNVRAARRRVGHEPRRVKHESDS